MPSADAIDSACVLERRKPLRIMGRQRVPQVTVLVFSFLRSPNAVGAHVPEQAVNNIYLCVCVCVFIYIIFTKIFLYT